MEVKKVCVGSKNPAKIEAVSNAIKSLWPDADIVGIDAPSGVSEQPMSDDEGITGASNRARYSIESENGDLAVGIEGIVSENSFGMFLRTWIVTIDKNGTKGIGDGGSIILPEFIASQVKKGTELGKVMDELTSKLNTSKGPGAYGILTNSIITRSDALERGVIFSLAPFISPEYYKLK